MLRYQAAFQLIARMQAQGVSWISGKQLDGNHCGTNDIATVGDHWCRAVFFWKQPLGIEELQHGMTT